MWGRLFIIPFVALVIGFIGMVDKADHMTAWVLTLCNDLPANAMFTAFYLPPPMNAWGMRPLSVGIMQVYLAVFGTALPPLWLIGAKALLGSLALGLSARAWLRIHGFEQVADVAAAAALLSSAHLFSSWYLTEFDAWGAAAILAGMALLQRPNALIPACGLLGMALLLKESSALMLFSFLGGGMVTAMLHNRRAQAIRHAIVLLLGGLCWLALVSPLLGSTGASAVGTTSIDQRLPLFEHNFAQLVHLTTPAGAAVLGLAGLWTIWPHRRRLLVAMTCGLLMICPLIIRHSHYETVYHAPHGTGLLLSGMLLFGLLSMGLISQRHRLAAVCAPVVAGQVIFAIAILGASSLREDFASRLFLAHGPLMFALIFDSLLRLWKNSDTTRPLVAMLAVATIWGPIVGGINHGLRWHIQQKLDHAGRMHLAQQSGLSDNDIVLFNNFQEWLGQEELTALGLQATVTGVPTPALLQQPRLGRDNFAMTENEASLETLLEEGQSIWLYWLTMRSTMPPAANASLRGDLSWTQRPLGVLTPFAWGQHAAETSLPTHNAIEDAHLTMFHDGPTMLEQRAESGTVLFERQQSLIQVPTELLSIPRRVITGAPVVEHHIIDVRIYRMDS